MRAGKINANRIRHTANRIDMRELSKYEQQAVDFLNATSTEMKVKFLKNDLYFAGDKEPRDIYQITLVNKLHKFVFKFGQSIYNSDRSITPTAYDVLSCLEKCPVTTFEDFCSDLGYDEDSRQAFKIYKAVRRERNNLEILFTEEQLEKLAEINLTRLRPDKRNTRQP